MASCMTLKRSFEHDRDSNTNPSTYESRTPSSKRQRRCFPVTVVSSPSSSSTSTETINDMSFGNSSTFPDVQPILSTGKKKKFSHFIWKLASFFPSFSRSDALLTRIKEEVRRLHRRNQLKSSTTNETTEEDTETSISNLPQQTNQHLLTLKQVNMICARLLKEREDKIREEYDQILSNKLNGKQN